MIENIPNDIEIKKQKPCVICGKMTTGDVCGQKCLEEWKRREEAKKRVKPLPQEKTGLPTNTTQQIKNFNDNPDTKKHGVIAMKKRTYWTIMAVVGFLCLLLLVNMVWSNSIYSGKEYGTKVDVNTPINVSPAQTDISNTYNNNNSHTINVNLDYDGISEIIADKVLEIINNETS